MRQAKQPFQFVSASYLIRITRDRAMTLEDLARILHSCSDASIFHHTFQSLERQHYVSFSSDFAQWVLTACNAPPLAERLAAIDLRDCTSIENLRKSLTSRVDGYISDNPSASTRRAFENFYFCEALEFLVNRDERAMNLAELEQGIRKMSLQTIHHHFINSRLRLRLQTNDFSNWIDTSLGLPELARRVEGIDIYVNTLDGLREEILQVIHPWIER
jgi:hypothetical protein